MASPTVRRRELANRLRAMRTHAGLTLDDAAKALECSAATMSRIENGLRAPLVRDVRDLTRLYEVDEQTAEELINLVEAARESGWWESYSELGEEYTTLIGFESAATSIAEHRGITIPGLLQTSAYLRAYMRDAINPQRAKPFAAREMAKRVEVAERRRQVLLPPRALSYSAFLDEACLRRTVGGRLVMADQLKYLVSLVALPNISIRVLPFSVGGHPGQPGGFCLITLGQADVRDVVYVDSLAGQLFLETDDDLERHQRVLLALSKVALSDAASQDFLANLERSLRE